jgi:creatinine amidohydrolase
MSNQIRRAFSLLLAGACLAVCQVKGAHQRGVLLEDLTWVEAESVLKPDTVVVIPIGAESKEHGPHLRLKNDFLLAEYLKRRVLESADVVVAPTVNYHYYPAFGEYPGSTTLRLETARDLLVDICRSLARHGPKRFYALNTGVSTLRALKLSADVLVNDGLLLRYTNILEIGAEAEEKIKKQEGGTHADEIETSLMLYISPENVDMKKAVKDYHPSQASGLTRDPNKAGVYSASGVYGDATLATRKKGEVMANAVLKGILQEIDGLRTAEVAGSR